MERRALRPSTPQPQALHANRSRIKSPSRSPRHEAPAITSSNHAPAIKPPLPANLRRVYNPRFRL